MVEIKKMWIEYLESFDFIPDFPAAKAISIPNINTFKNIIFPVL